MRYLVQPPGCPGGKPDVSRWGLHCWKVNLCILAVWIIVIADLAMLVGGPRPWENGFVLALLVLTTGVGIRSAALVLSAVLFWASFPAVQLPTYWFCFVPLVWVWRRKNPGLVWAWESFAVGFVTGWLVAPFIRTSLPLYGLLVQIVPCSLFGIQILGVATGLRAVQRMPAVPAAILAGLFATGCEVLQAIYGFGWSDMALALPAASSPVAQWAFYVGPFGVSFFLYVLNFLWLPELRLSGLMKWVAPATACILAGLACIGGRYLQNQVDLTPMRFTALLVQPGSHAPRATFKVSKQLPRWRVLDRLTTVALNQVPPVDLIIWPGGSLETTSPWADQFATPLTNAEDAKRSRKDNAGVAAITAPGGQAFNLSEFCRYLMPRYVTPCLLGSPIEVREGECYKSGCLLEPDGSASRHDKVKLCPFSDTLPWWLDNHWVRTHLPSVVDMCGDFQPGKDFHLLEFKTRKGEPIKVAVVVSYEMFFPWLPQYHQQGKVDAVVHLANEQWCVHYPNYWQFETWACQYRAIESRNWQLVCTSLGNTAVIDPRGVIHAALRGQAGVIRTSDLVGYAEGKEGQWDLAWLKQPQDQQTP